MLRTPRPASIIANIHRSWRRSLQLRVITITLATSAALVITFGLVVSSLITDGFVAGKRETAKRAVDDGSTFAVAQLSSQIATPRDSLAGGVVGQVVQNLEAREDRVTVAILPGDDQARPLKGTSRLALP